jgi:hypothetical protein
MSRLMYQSSARSLNVITSCASLVSSLVICFASQIFAQMNKCFSGSSAASPQNSSNLIVGSCLAILNTELIPPLRGVDTWLVLPELAPPVVATAVDVLLAIGLPPNFGCLNGGVLFGVLVAHGFMGSTMTLIPGDTKIHLSWSSSIKIGSKNSSSFLPLYSLSSIYPSSVSASPLPPCTQ